MHIVKLTALRPLRGDFGTLANPSDLAGRSIDEGGAFTADNLTAERLEAAGLAQRYRAPRPPETKAQPAAPQNKMLPAAPQNKAAATEKDEDDLHVSELSEDEARALPPLLYGAPHARRHRR